MHHIRPLAPGDAGWVLQRHAEHYCGGLGFAREFEPLLAEILTRFLEKLTSDTHRGWIAWDPDGGTRLGCVFTQPIDAETGQLRLFFVEPQARGTGIAQHLFETLAAHGRACGWRRIVLWTHAEHVEAGAFYRRNGFLRRSAEPRSSYGKAMIVEHWEKDLTAPDDLAIARSQS